MRKEVREGEKEEEEELINVNGEPIHPAEEIVPHAQKLIEEAENFDDLHDSYHQLLQIIEQYKKLGKDEFVTEFEKAKVLLEEALNKMREDFKDLTPDNVVMTPRGVILNAHRIIRIAKTKAQLRIALLQLDRASNDDLTQYIPDDPELVEEYKAAFIEAKSLIEKYAENFAEVENDKVTLISHIIPEITNAIAACNTMSELEDLKGSIDGLIQSYEILNEPEFVEAYKRGKSFVEIAIASLI